jgi:hypothetical protein
MQGKWNQAGGGKMIFGRCMENRGLSERFGEKTGSFM